MGQAGAQREPSMEEILASIRRIIENSEPGAEAGAAQAAAAFSQPESSDPSDDDAYGLDYSDDVPESQHSSANDDRSSQPVSLADVAARARAMPDPVRAPVENGADEPSAEQPAIETPDFMDDAAEELRQALVSDEPVEAAPEEARPEPAQMQAAPSPAQAATAPYAPSQPAPTPAASGQAAPSSGHEAEGNPEDHAQPPEDMERSGGHLVSLQTGEKVAAAFGELDAAIAAEQRRSFDEIAEEMLRPMLTQWLDDNLPTLVERLVREEIERVSRGNRR